MATVKDFHVIVNRIAGDSEEGRFVVVVADAPVSRFQKELGQFTLRQVEGEPTIWMAVHTRFALRRDATKGFQLGVENERRLVDEELGGELFQLLFPRQSAARELLGWSCGNLEGDDYLRIKLELHPELSNLPWETMECPLNEEWALQINKAKVSVIRYLGTCRAPKVSVNYNKPCILIVKANPLPYESQEVTQSLSNELKNLQTALSSLQDQYALDIIEGSDTLNQIARRIHNLETSGSHVVGLHFMGHGGIDEKGGFFAGENEDGELERIYTKGLLKSLDPAESIRWIILNACWTATEPAGCPLAGLATSLSLLKDVPTVIAYKRPVGTKDAETLASDFYKNMLESEVGIGSRTLERVVRSLQLRCSNPGGLVVLVRDVERKAEASVVPPSEGHQSSTTGPLARARGEVGAPLTGIPGTSQSGIAAKAKRSDQAPVSLTRSGQMVEIPAGPFQRGFNSAQIEFLLSEFNKHGMRLDAVSARKALSEETYETVELSAFMIDKAPVTNGQFAAFVEETSYVTQAERAGDSQTWRIHDVRSEVEHPVIFVTYDDASAYCDWAKKRLPSADEWKKAYRGPSGTIYPWGDTFDLNLCNTAESSRGWETTPVTKFPKGVSGYGCFDMVGNVEEWTSTPGPEGTKVVLGGSWCMTCEIYGLPVLHRMARPGFYSKDTGFRCARDI